MQALGAVTPAQLLTAGQQPLIKVEIYVGAAWINLNSLAGENYVESGSISLGGASMTPNPVAGKWSASLFNEDSIFHPQHPTSPYNGYLETERLTRVSIGATYGGVDYYWQRIIGYMDVPKFSAPDYRVAISGGDYMKRLRDTELRRPNNYWGASATFNSISSDGTVGVELYAQADAMEIGAGERDNVANWATTNCTFVSLAGIGGGSAFVGRFISTAEFAFTRNPAVCNIVAGTEYVCTFKARRIAGVGRAGVYMGQLIGGNLVSIIAYAIIDSDAWKTYSFYFTGLINGPLYMTLHTNRSGEEVRIDQISIHNFTPYWERYYALPGASRTPYYVTLDSGAGAVPAWQGEGDEDWKYDEDLEAGPDPPAHPAKIVYFNINKTVPEGNVGAVPPNNLVIYYFTVTALEDVVARLLWYAGVFDPATNLPYANEAAAKAAIVGAPEYVDPAIDLDMVWFKAGTTCLNAIKMICERCNYRFYFKYDGTPVFRPRPTAGVAVFTFTDPKHIASIAGPYQSRNEIKNRIVIKGLRQSDTVGKEETMPSDLTGEDSDAGSITAYGERTLTIDNHLFQSQATINAMCTALVGEYKDPKWYSDLKMDYLPVPLELGDNIQWEERLNPTLDITQTGIIRNIKLGNFSAVYKCEHT